MFDGQRRRDAIDRTTDHHIYVFLSVALPVVKKFDQFLMTELTRPPTNGTTHSTKCVVFSFCAVLGSWSVAETGQHGASAFGAGGR